MDIARAFAISRRVKAIIRRGLIVAIACVGGACAPTNGLMAKTGPAGTRYNSNGKVTLHRGQPCTSQIMFDFHPVGSKSIIWLAAGSHESKKLTEAASRHRGVRVTGVWKRGRDTGCGYVDIEKVTVEATFWNKLFKP